MLRRLYDRVLQLAASPLAPMWLAAIAFAESSFFPIPPDVLLVPMALAQPDRAFRYAAICTVASVAGGIGGYVIGYALFDVLAQPLLHFYHYEDAFNAFQTRFREYGVYIILIKGLTPIPYKIVAIASGAARFDILVFIAASILTRGVRFFLIALLLRQFGEPVRAFIEDRLVVVLLATAAFAVLGFFLIKYL
jgi:membrane protein YqaA with SNARE-associated domain